MKVQQVLTKLGALESFLLDRTRWDDPDSTQADVELLRDSWTVCGAWTKMGTVEWIRQGPQQKIWH